MYWYEKDYIMRLIHGIARILARMLFNRELEDDGELVMILEESGRESNDYLRRMIDDGRVNAAEEKLFDLIESAAWDARQPTWDGSSHRKSRGSHPWVRRAWRAGTGSRPRSAS